MTSTHSSTAAQLDLRSQLKGIRTFSHVQLHGPGIGTFAGRTFRLVQRNRAGCAVFQPLGLNDERFVPLSSTDFTVRPAPKVR